METSRHGVEHLLDFDYSVRVQLSHSSRCGDRQRSVILKLRLANDDRSERQVVLELDDKQLAHLLSICGSIYQQLPTTSVSCRGLGPIMSPPAEQLATQVYDRFCFFLYVYPLVVHKKKVPRCLLLHIFHRVKLVDARTVVRRVSPERDFQLFQERIHACQQALRSVGRTLDPGLPVINHDSVSQVRGHDKIVLHDKRRFLGVKNEPLNHFRGQDTLF
ncbi:hypothetical protein PsorP6_009854 [Peronosclerospora sorghi]|uniref:Uncharacterized protein n=1 Tax=Peronosclerospora sorghi TaxID=230839 RepID=A0ACC0VYF0_9STRA|nr:hypothetical protein PsorP6_009854 [Peronosclerospora sorghi]